MNAHGFIVVASFFALLSGVAGCDFHPDLGLDNAQLRSSTLGIVDGTRVIDSNDSDFVFVLDGGTSCLMTSGTSAPQFRYDETGISSLRDPEVCTFEDGTLVRNGEDALIVDGDRVLDPEGNELYKFAGSKILAPTEPPSATVTLDKKAVNLTKTSPKDKLLYAALLEGICGSRGLRRF
jgi:hypothetical protein